MCFQEERNLVHFPLVCYHYNIDLENPNLFKSDRSLKQRDMALWVRQRGFLD